MNKSAIMAAEDIDALVASVSKWSFVGDPSIKESGPERIKKLIEEFDIVRTSKTIVSYCVQNSVCNVALQFPDSQLQHAPLVSQALKYLSDCVLSETSPDYRPIFLYIIGDTTYSECCVDEVAAQHLDTHLIVHYGPACLSPVTNIPVLYVFPMCHLENARGACDALKTSLSEIQDSPNVDRIVILFDVELYPYFQKERFQVDQCLLNYKDVAHEVHIDVATPRLSDPYEIQIPGRFQKEVAGVVNMGPLCYNESSIPRHRTAYVWYTSTQSMNGDWSSTVRNAALLLNTGSDPCAIFHCVTLVHRTPSSKLDAPQLDAQRFLRRRFAQLLKAKDASLIGILPGPLGNFSNGDVIKRCEKIVSMAGKRSYIIGAGKVTPARLANFAEIDVFVLIACPQNALLDAKDFLRPIITPLELEAALLTNGDIFSRAYSVDVADILLHEPDLSTLNVNDSDSIEHGHDENSEGQRNNTLAIRGEWHVGVQNSRGGADFLKERLWQGLKYAQGGTDNETNIAELPVDAQPGQSGIASHYDREEVVKENDW